MFMMMNCISGLSVFFLSMVCFICILQHSFMMCINADNQVDALIAFKNAVTSSNGALDSWDENLVNPCTWFQITCLRDSDYVTRVDLANLQLSGSLVSELSNLKTLQYLELYNNNLHGPIPSELGNLTQLISLDLYNNTLTGSIPKSLGNLQNLMFLRLNNNTLSGRIPVQELVPIGIRGGVVDISENPNLCSDYTVPPCPNI